MTLRQLWRPLAGVALLVTGGWFGAPPSAAAATGGCTGDVVVALGVAVWSRPGHDSYQFSLDRPLPAGEWTVRTRSYDAYPDRSDTPQPHEQWVVDIPGHGVLGPTSDLSDGVDAAAADDVLGSFVSAGGVSGFTVRHAAPSTPGGTNSVIADCVSFTLVPPPTTTTTVPPTTTTVPPTTTTVPPTTTTARPTTTTVPAPPPTTTTAPPDTPAPPVAAPRPADISAAAAVDCLAERVYVLLGNQGERGAIVDVALPLSAVQSGIELGGGTATTTTLLIGDLEGAAEIRVTDSTTGEPYLRTPLEINCDQPARPTAATVLDCTAGMLVVVLGNDAGDPARLWVVHERVAVIDEVVVEAGAVVQVGVPLGGVAAVAVRVVDGDGADVLRTTVDNICPPKDPPDDGDVVSDPEGTGGGGADAGTCATSVQAAPECADVRVVVEPDCPRSMADVSIRRQGVGRERFVVLVDGVVAGVVTIEGAGDGTVPVSLSTTDAVLTVSRSTATDAIVVGTLSCRTGTSRAGPIAASLVVFAMLSTAAGVMPWPLRLRPGAV